MYDAVALAVGWVKAFLPENAKIYTEKRLNIAKSAGLDADLWGTADLIAYNRDTLALIDYKHGLHPVSAKNNKQLLTYLLAFSKSWHKFDRIVAAIAQPRASKSFKVWDVPISTLEEWRNTVNYAILETRKPDPLLKTGGHCFFCPCKPICPAYLAEVEAKEAKDTEDFFKACGI